MQLLVDICLGLTLVLVILGVLRASFAGLLETGPVRRRARHLDAPTAV